MHTIKIELKFFGKHSSLDATKKDSRIDRRVFFFFFPLERKKRKMMYTRPEDNNLR